MMVSPTLSRQGYALDRALGSVLGGALRVKLINRMFEAARRVEAGEVARIVAAARRMTDLWYLSTAHGLAPTLENGIQVVSDRMLGLLPNGVWAQDVSPTLALDEVTISGDTMKKLVVACERLTGGAEGSVVPFPLVELRDDTEAEKTVIAELHRGFAQAFASAVTPYVTDFVVSNQVKTTPEQMISIFADEQWQVVDVTGAQSADKPTWACSLFPHGDLHERFMDGLGRVRDLVQVVKVRVFSASTGGGESIVRFVPMVLTRGLPTDGLTCWLELKGLAVGRQTEADALVAAATLVSMILSASLFEVFRDHLAAEHSVEIGEDQAFARLVAGPQFVDLVCPAVPSELECLLGDAAQKGGAARVSPSVEVSEKPLTWPDRTSGNDAHYFMAGDDDVKHPLEEIERATNKKLAQETDGREGVGIPLADLASRVGSSVKRTSIALDILNDSGAAVNESRLMDGRVERVSRTAEFAPKYEHLTKCFGGGRLAVRLTTI
ncbi:MAG: hypothetical protein LBK59_04605, partial [Bifidobacteriaceae bacterium]|nr:hypothetical protein [Bifidobacteriaceae bacterium]